MVYDDIYDAKNAVDHLSGFNVAGRYLICLYYQPRTINMMTDLVKKKQENENLKLQLGVQIEK